MMRTRSLPISAALQAALIVSAIGVGTSAGVASASVCSPLTDPNANYYAQFFSANTSVAPHGASADLYTSSLTSGDPTIEFVNHEMWYGVTGNCTFWVEVGVSDGPAYAGGAHDQDIFWADQRNGGGYHEHYSSASWSLNAWYTAKVGWAGNNSWDVYFGAIKLGTSTNNTPGSLRCLQSGIEANYAFSSDHAGGRMTNWKHKSSGDVWSAGWGTSSLSSDCPADIDISNGITTEVLHGPN